MALRACGADFRDIAFLGRHDDREGLQRDSESGSAKEAGMTTY
jgi:hypothetical protein